MELDRVKYENEKPYIEYIKRDNKIQKVSGIIIKCDNCGKGCFSTYYKFKKAKRHYCSYDCHAQLKNNPRWKGGINKHSDGYILLKRPKHPNSNNHGYIQEHRLIVEKIIGRYLHRWEVVHHINKIKDDNRIHNLMVFNNDGAHRAYDKGLNVDNKYIIFDGSNLTKGT